MGELTDQSRRFIDAVPAGAWYCLSRESAGIDFSGAAGEEARRLAEINFARVRAMSGLDLRPGAEPAGR